MNSNKINNSIQDTQNLTFSRQLGKLYSQEEFKSIQQLTVLIYGLEGVGIEIMKNLYHLGITNFYLYDEELVTIRSLSINYLLRENDNGKRNDQAIKQKFEEVYKLNNYQIHVISNYQMLNELILGRKINICIVCNKFELQQLYLLDNLCRNSKCRFIWTGCWGLQGFVFNDFGEKFHSSNPFFENKIFGKVISIQTNDLNSICTSPSIKIHVQCYQDYFKKDQTVQIQNCQFKIMECKQISEQFQELTINGMLGFIQKGDTIESLFSELDTEFQSLNDFFEKRNNEEYMDQKCTYQQRYVLPVNFVNQIYSILKFQQAKKRPPFIMNNNDYGEVLEIMKQEQNVENPDEEQLTQLQLSCKLFQTQLAPICNIISAIASQEAMKIIGKGLINNQFFIYENYSMINDIQKQRIFECNLGNINTTQLENSKYFHQITIFGPEFQEQLEKLNVLVVGAGALGSEYAKLLALSGSCQARSSKSGLATIIDSDFIEQSNLNRQFLFSLEDVQKKEYKSKVLKKKMKEINDAMNVKSHIFNATSKSEKILTNKFYSNLDAVLVSVDNNKARQYISNKAQVCNFMMLEAGTDTLKCNSSVFIPQYTTNKQFEIEHDDEIFSCTIAGIPRKLTDNIQWAYMFFDQYFVKMAEQLQTAIANKDLDQFILGTQDQPSQLLMKRIYYINLLKLAVFYNLPKEDDINQLTQFVNQQLVNISKEVIQQVYLINSTLQHDKNPSVLQDLKTQNDLLYYYCNILATLYQLPFLNFNDFTEYMKNPSTKSNQFTQFQMKIDAISFQDILSYSQQHSILNIQKFDKDSIELKHVDFIQSLSNFRGLIFDLPTEPDINKVRQLIGKITVSVISTSAFICGANMLELYRYINYFKLLSSQRQTQDLRNLVDNFREYGCLFSNLKDGVSMASPIKASIADQQSCIYYKPTRKNELLQTLLNELGKKYTQFTIKKILIPTMEIDFKRIFQDNGLRSDHRYLKKKLQVFIQKPKDYRIQIIKASYIQCL